MNRNPGVVYTADVLQSLLRSWWTIVAGLCFGLCAGLAAWHYLPKTFEAKTTVFVAPSQLPQEFGRAPSVDDMAVRLSSVREAILSQPLLTRLAREQFGAAKDAPVPEPQLDDLRQRIGTTLVRIDDRRGAGVFEVTFRDSDPVRSARALNALTDLYIDENVRLRSHQAAGASTVFQGLASEVGRQMQEQERAVAAFKSAHLYELPEHKDTNVRLMESRQHDLETAERDLGQAQQNRDLLAAQADFARQSPVQTGGPAVRETRAERIARLQGELTALRDRYTDAHPLVRLKRDEVARAKAAPNDDQERTGAAGAAPPDEFAAKIAAADREIARLRGVREGIEAEIRQYQARLAQTPAVDQQLRELTKGYDVLADRYKDYQGRIESARGSEALSQLRKGEQFEIMERAVPASQPIRPILALVIGAGIVLGLIVFVGPPLLRAMFAPRVLSREGLRLISPVPIVASFADLDTPRHRRVRARRVLWNWSAVAVSIAAAVLSTFAFMG